MNTLSRAVTARFFQDRDAFHRFQNAWRTLARANSKSLRAEHHMLYAMLRGADWRKGFSPVSNHNKLLNGGMSAWQARAAFATVRFFALNAEHFSAVFGDTITPDTFVRLRALLPEYNQWSASPRDWSDGYPFDAYRTPAQQESDHAS